MSMMGNVALITGKQRITLIDHPDTLEEFMDDLDRDGPSYVSTAKHWQALGVIAPALEDLIEGGEAIGGDFAGNGPVQSFSPDEVKQLAATLAKVTEAQLRDRFKPDQMMEDDIYPGSWSAADCDLLIATFEQTRKLIVAGAAAKEAMIAWID